MHTTEIDGFMFVHHGDYSGDVKIWAVGDSPGQHAEPALEIPMTVLVQLVAEYVRAEKIAELEQLAAAALLGLTVGGK